MKPINVTKHEININAKKEPNCYAATVNQIHSCDNGSLKHLSGGVIFKVFKISKEKDAK